MHIRHGDLLELEAAAGARWLERACDRLRSLPGHPEGRILVAEDDGAVRAVVGLELEGACNGRPERATIRVIEVDPAHDRRGIDSRLVRFAEGIAHLNGCLRVELDPRLERPAEGRCWSAPGSDEPHAGLGEDLAPITARTCS